MFICKIIFYSLMMFLDIKLKIVIFISLKEYSSFTLNINNL